VKIYVMFPEPSLATVRLELVEEAKKL